MTGNNKPVEVLTRSKLARTATDAGTIALSLAFGAVACRSGYIESGIAAAALALPLYYSVAGILARHPGDDGELYRKYGQNSGLQTMKNALKDAFKDVKAGLALATIVTFAGLTVGVVNKDLREVIEEQAHHQLVSKLPVLSPDTIIKPATKASDLCINRNGQKISDGKEIAYKYSGVEYKIVCR